MSVRFRNCRRLGVWGCRCPGVPMFGSAEVPGSGVCWDPGFREVPDSRVLRVPEREVWGVPNSGDFGGAGIWGSGCEAGAINSDGRAPHPRPVGRSFRPSWSVPPRDGAGRAGAALKAAAAPGPATCRRRPRPRNAPGTQREHTGPQREPPLRELIGNRPGNPPDTPSLRDPPLRSGNPPGTNPSTGNLHRDRPRTPAPDSGNRDAYPGYRNRAANPSRDTGTEPGPRPQAPALTPGTGTLPEHWV